ncbi:hypothetical protein ASG74_10720 [Knoellia sp. Soil729]|nr:hypothetical protein ASG74_10720 [Knoellia sp. Soil729]
MVSAAATLAQHRNLVRESRTHDEAFEFAVAKLSELLREERTNPRAAVRFLRVLRQIQKPEHVFPHITADEEGEIIALWSASKMSLELAIPAEGDAYLRMTDHDGSEIVVGFFRWLPLLETSNFLSDLSDLVVQSNPRWRSLFAS